MDVFDTIMAIICDVGGILVIFSPTILLGVLWWLAWHMGAAWWIGEVFQCLTFLFGGFTLAVSELLR